MAIEEEGRGPFEFLRNTVFNTAGFFKPNVVIYEEVRVAFSLLLPVATRSYRLFSLLLPSSVPYTIHTPEIMPDFEIGWAQKWA